MSERCEFPLHCSEGPGEHTHALAPLPLARVLVAIGELRGAHVHVIVRGEGQDGSRPLLGTLVMSEREWAVLRDCLSISEEP